MQKKKKEKKEHLLSFTRIHFNFLILLLFSKFQLYLIKAF